MVVRFVITRLLKLVLIILVLYIIYAILGSTLPYIPSKNVSRESMEWLSSYRFKGDGNPGPDRITLVESTVEAMGARIEILRYAEHSLDIAYHSITEGETTSAFFGEILNAADRGVRVRILLDGKVAVLSPEVSRIMHILENHRNISCRMYNRLDWKRPWKWHTLLHDKFILADNSLLLLGGRNIGDRYYAPRNYSKEVTNDRDVLVSNTTGSAGSVMTEMQAYMELLWNSEDSVPWKTRKAGAGFEDRLKKAAADFDQTNPAYFRLSMDDYLARSVETSKITLAYNPVHTNKKEPWVGYLMGKLVLDASDSVLFQTPYATANKRLLEILEASSASVDTVMLTNSMASSPNAAAFSNYYSQRKKFTGTGVSIYEYQNTHSIHGKSIVADNSLSAVGSFNMDDRSFYIDTENMLIIDSPLFAEILTGAMEDYLALSLKVGPDNRYELNPDVAALPVKLPKKILMWTVSVFSRLFQFLI